jgi:hypothetical protein
MATAEPELLKRRYDRLKATTERTNCESHWEDLAEHVLPGSMGFTGKRTPGEKRMQKVLDSTGIHSNELLAAGLHGMATNPASKWFSLRMTNDALNKVPNVKNYLAAVEKEMWSAVYSPGTNLTTALHECYLSMGCFGPAIMFVGERDNGGILFQSRTLSECVVAENADGVVDTIFWKFVYTVRQCVQKGQQEGWKVSAEVQSNYNAQKFDDEVEIIHAVYPRKDRDTGKDDAENMAFASCYFEYKAGHLLHENGFQEFPFLVPRWAKMPGEVYGRSPGMTALPDIKMLQAMMLTLIKAAQKIADPPLFIPDDGVIGPVRTVPGGLNFYRGSREIFPLPTSNGLPLDFEMMEALRNRIRTTFYTDILQITQSTQMTATEVMQRTQERMRLLGPMVGRLEAELLGPLVTRVFGILYRQGLLPPAPEEIQEKDFTVEYVSPIATAQKQTEANGMMQVWQMLGMFGPEIAAQIIQQNQNVDRTYSYLWDLFNNDPSLLKTAEEREGEEQQKQQMMAAQMGMQAGTAGADMAQKGSGALKNLSQANAQEGTDYSEIIAQVMKQVKANPRLQQNLRGAAEESGLPPESFETGEPVEMMQ